MNFNENRNYSNRSSLLSERIKSISSLNDSREIILENLNGTYSHGIKHKKSPEHSQEDGEELEDFNGYPRGRVVYVVDEDEIALISEIQPLPTHVDEFVEELLRHEKYFFWYICALFSFDFLYSASSWSNRTSALVELTSVYKSENMDLFNTLYSIAIIVEFIYMIIYYPLIGVAVHKKSIQFYSWFSLVSLFGLLLQVFFAFLNRFSIALFLMRFAALIYSRFISQMLLSLMLLPQ